MPRFCGGTAVTGAVASLPRTQSEAHSALPPEVLEPVASLPNALANCRDAIQRLQRWGQVRPFSSEVSIWTSWEELKA